MVPRGRRELAAKPLEIPEIVSFPIEVDISNCDGLAADLIAAIQPGAAVVIADLSRTKFCDGAAIRCLLAAHDHAAARGVELRAVVRSSAIWRLLVLLGGEDKLRVYPDMQAGLAGAPSVARGSQPDCAASTAADEVARLSQRVSIMPVIEQAKGILMYYEHCTADEAFAMLRSASQRSNVPVREIAAAIVERTSD
jgi:anti-anti-sigma regulatory factor